MNRAYTALGLLILVGPAACGASSEASLDAGVPQDRLLSSLTPAEAQRVCNAVAARHAAMASTAAYKDGFCLYQALLSATVNGQLQNLTPTQMVQQCQSTYSQYRALMNGGGGGSGNATCTIQGCADATVGDYELCFSGMDDSWLAFFGQLPSCSALASGQDPFDSLSAPSQPAECSKLLACGITPSNA